MHSWGKNSATELYPELSSTLFCNYDSYDSYLELGIIFVLSVLTIQCVQVEVVIAPNLLLSCFLPQRKSASSYFAWPKAGTGTLQAFSGFPQLSAPLLWSCLLPFAVTRHCPLRPQTCPMRVCFYFKVSWLHYLFPHNHFWVRFLSALGFTTASSDILNSLCRVTTGLSVDHTPTPLE